MKDAYNVKAIKEMNSFEHLVGYRMNESNWGNLYDVLQTLINGNEHDRVCAQQILADLFIQAEMKNTYDKELCESYDSTINGNIDAQIKRIEKLEAERDDIPWGRPEDSSFADADFRNENKFDYVPF